MASKDLILVDLISDVVDSMRATDSVVSSSEVNGLYTIVSANTLVENEVVTINTVDYIVNNPNVDNFQITGATGLDFAGEIWKAKAPYYEHGHILEIHNTLARKTKGIFAYQKYPLIILFQDYKGTKSVSDDAIFGTVSGSNFAIATGTEATLKSSERYNLNFRTILFPLYDQFLEAIRDIEYFDTSPGTAVVDHDWFERPYWGSDLANNNQNILPGFIDAIELQNMELKILNGIKNC